jgi:translocation and assembly module TamB
MQDSDILAYVVLGHPLGNDGGQANLMAKAAGALLGSSQASVLFDRIRDQLGLSSLEIQDSVGGTSTMGYKPLQVTPPGKVATTQESVAETTLSVGKYLTPQLYVSYGRSLFSGSNLFRLRYDIFKNWQIETQAGNESGVDLYYRLEFK